MRTLPKFPAVLVLSLVEVSAAAQTNPADEKDILAIASQLQDAWNKADAKALAALHAALVDLVADRVQVVGAQ